MNLPSVQQLAAANAAEYAQRTVCSESFDARRAAWVARESMKTAPDVSAMPQAIATRILEQHAWAAIAEELLSINAAREDRQPLHDVRLAQAVDAVAVLPGAMPEIIGRTLLREPIRDVARATNLHAHNVVAWGTQFGEMVLRRLSIQPTQEPAG